MVTKIRLKRIGKKKAPFYRIIVTDSRNKRDGRVIEEIGKYHPMQKPSYISVDSQRAIYWLSVGAQTSLAVRKIFELTGDYQKFRGDKSAKSSVKGFQKSVDIEAKIAQINDEAEKMKHEAAKKKAEVEAKIQQEAKAPAETPAETPAAEAPAETPAETPAAEAPAEAETPAENSAEASAETPAETPAAEAPAEAETPAAEAPAPANDSVDKSDNSVDSQTEESQEGK
jgi:small subunit ribosomal protein S16